MFKEDITKLVCFLREIRECNLEICLKRPSLIRSTFYGQEIPRLEGKFENNTCMLKGEIPLSWGSMLKNAREFLRGQGQIEICSLGSKTQRKAFLRVML